jgi:hypothetical protein
MTDTSTALATITRGGKLRIEIARELIAKCTSIDEANRIRIEEEALLQEAEKRGDDISTRNDFAEISIRAQRKLGEFFSAKQKEYAQKKSEWMASARKNFSPGKPESCSFCGLFRSIAHAHHVWPLAAQYEFRGGTEPPDHKHIWLCPNHHALLHGFLNRAEDSADRGRRMFEVMDDFPDENEKLKFIRWCVDLMEKKP